MLARFVPIVRTFAPILAGAGSMRYRDFIFYNILGGFIWTTAMVLGGYFLGSYIPHLDRYLLPIIAVIIIFSFLPILAEWRKKR